MKAISIFFLLFALLSIRSVAQNTAAGDLSLKIFANLSFEKGETEFLNLVKDTLFEGITSTAVSKFGSFTPAFAIYHHGGHFSEIEIVALQAKRQDHVQVGALSGPFPGTTNSFSIALRYGYHFNLLNRHRGAVRPYIGFAATPYLRVDSATPDNLLLYDTKESIAGLLGQVCPRLNFVLTDYVFLDFNVLITAVKLSNHSLKLENGKSSYSPSKESNSEVRWLPNRTVIRLGFGVLF